MSFFRHYFGTLAQIAKNRSILLTMVLSVVFYSFFYPTAYKAERPADLPIVIVDEEKSPLSEKIINTATHVEKIRIIEITDSMSEAKHKVQAQQADAILFLPNNLSQSIHHGEGSGIGFYLSSAYFLRTQAISTGLASTIETVLLEEIEKFTHITHKHPAPFVHSTPLFNPLSGYGSYIFPAVAPMIIHQTILLGLCMLISGYRERRWRASISEFLAIFAAAVTIGSLTSLYLFGFAFWWHDYPRGGNFWGMLLAVPIFVGCVASLGLLVASFLDNSERAGAALVFSSVPLFMLSGVAYPLIAMPEFMQKIAQLLPSTQGIQMFIQLNQMGAPTAAVLSKIYFLLTLMSICLVLAFWRLSRSYKIQ